MKATIKVIGEVVVVNDKFKKRELVLTFDNGKYPEYRIHQLVQDKVSLTDGYRVGDVVDVEINYKGREWVSPSCEVKYFNSDEVWKIERVDCSGDTAHDTAHDLITEEEDLPF